MTISAPDFSARSMAIFKRRAVFRVRRVHGREAAVLDVLLGHGEHFEAEIPQHRHVDVAAGAVEVGEDDLGGRAFQQRRLEQQGLEAGDVERVHFRAEDGDGAALGGVFVELAGDRVHLLDDAVGVGIDDLRAVVEIGFEAVVVRRIVAGGEDDAGVGAEFAHGEGKLRRGARAFEEIGIAAEIRADLGAEFREIAREMAGVMGEDEHRLAVRPGELPWCRRSVPGRRG